MKASREQLLIEVRTDIQKRKCWATLTTICRYLQAEQKRSPRALKIGICTVFILVMIITMFKSVIDSSPVLFVKVGQEQVGAVDFIIAA